MARLPLLAALLLAGCPPARSPLHDCLRACEAATATDTAFAACGCSCVERYEGASENTRALCRVWESGCAAHAGGEG